MENIKKYEEYFNTHYKQINRWKHAVIGDSVKKCKILKFPSLHGKIETNNGNILQVTLDKCECVDFMKRKQPCVHMMKFAIEVGVYDKVKNIAIDKIQNLSDRAYECFSQNLYYGYYEETHKAERYPQKIFREIAEQNLIEFENPNFKYSDFTRENIIAVIYATYSDPRNKM